MSSRLSQASFTLLAGGDENPRGALLSWREIVDRTGQLTDQDVRELIVTYGRRAVALAALSEAYDALDGIAGDFANAEDYLNKVRTFLTMGRSRAKGKFDQVMEDAT